MLINYLLSSCNDLQDIPLGNTDFSRFTNGFYIKDDMANTMLGMLLLLFDVAEAAPLSVAISAPQAALHALAPACGVSQVAQW